MRVDLSAAMHVVDRHPAVPIGKKIAHQLWSWAGLLIFLGGPIYAFFGGWYWAPIGVVVGLLVMKGSRESAASFVAETAQENPAFKAEMVHAGVIRED